MKLNIKYQNGTEQYTVNSANPFSHVSHPSPHSQREQKYHSPEGTLRKYLSFSGIIINVCVCELKDLKRGI